MITWPSSTSAGTVTATDSEDTVTLGEMGCGCWVEKYLNKSSSVCQTPKFLFLPPKCGVAQLGVGNFRKRPECGWSIGESPKVRRNKPRLQHESLSRWEGFILLNLPDKWKLHIFIIVANNSQVTWTNRKCMKSVRNASSITKQNFTVN